MRQYGSTNYPLTKEADLVCMSPLGNKYGNFPRSLDRRLISSYNGALGD
jgi:hypothetical protein